MRFVLILMISALAACSPQAVKSPVSIGESPGLGTNHIIQMTAQECSQVGGVIVGDIGDGRIHKSDYLCQNGETPLGTIVPREGEPIAIEGAVCCGG